MEWESGSKILGSFVYWVRREPPGDTGALSREFTNPLRRNRAHPVEIAWRKPRLWWPKQRDRFLTRPRTKPPMLKSIYETLLLFYVFFSPFGTGIALLLHAVGVLTIPHPWIFTSAMTILWASSVLLAFVTVD